MTRTLIIVAIEGIATGLSPKKSLYHTYPPRLLDNKGGDGTAILGSIPAA
jgi:hypothetical protein